MDGALLVGGWTRCRDGLQDRPCTARVGGDRGQHGPSLEENTSKTPAPPEQRPASRIESLTAVIARWRARWGDRNRERLYERRCIHRANQAEIARREGITRARVTQVMGMLRLVPELQEHVLSLPDMVRRPTITP